MLRFQISGYSKLDELEEMKWVEKAMHHVMIQAKNQAVNHYCPVDTTMLRDSIYMRKVGQMLYELGATMYYGVWHEFGSYNIHEGTVENPNLIKSGYSPFLRPAIWKEMKNFSRFINQEINDMEKKEIRR